MRISGMIYHMVARDENIARNEETRTKGHSAKSACLRHWSLSNDATNYVPIVANDFVKVFTLWFQSASRYW